MSEIGRKFESYEGPKVDPEKIEKLKQDDFERREKEAAAAEKEHDKMLESIREKLEKVAEKQPKTKIESKEQDNESPLNIFTGTYKKQVAKQALSRTQKELSKPERAFSKAVHQPAVEAVSAVVGGTMARPSGLLSGGLCSLLASVIVLYTCHHYGYEYNFSVGLLALAGGFAVGILLEGLIKLTRIKKH